MLDQYFLALAQPLMVVQGIILLMMAPLKMMELYDMVIFIMYLMFMVF